MNGLGTMLTRSMKKVALAAIVAMASVSPTLAAKHHTHHTAKMPNACTKPELRCTVCDKDQWCRVYACSGGETVVLPLPCGENSGLCFAPHC